MTDSQDTKEWSQPSFVDKFLFLGNIKHAINPVLLDFFGIKNVISIGQYTVPAEYRRQGTRYQSLKPKTDLLEYFEPTYSIIKKHREDKRSVLVHCDEADGAKSATIVAAFLMKYNKWTYSQAATHVLKARPGVQMPSELERQLQKFEQKKYYDL